MKALLQASVQGVCGSGEYYYRVSSRRTKNKEVSIMHTCNAKTFWCVVVVVDCV